MLPLPHQQARRRRRPASLLAGVLFACCLLSSALTASAFYVSSVQGHRIVLPRAQLHHRAQLYHPIVGAPADISLEKTERFPMLFDHFPEVADANVEQAASIGSQFLFALFMVSLIDDAAAVLAVWCTGCSAHAPTGIMKPICSALPFAPEDILTQLTHASHMVLPW